MSEMVGEMVERTFRRIPHRTLPRGGQRYDCSLCRGTTNDPIRHAFDARCKPWWWFGRTEEEMIAAASS